MKIFYFTSTGNCLEVAKKIGGELYSIPQVLKNNQLHFEDEKIGVIFPSYMGNSPDIVAEFLEKVTLKTNYFFGIVTYGMTDMGSLNQFQKLAKKNGLKPNYLNRILMVDNNLRLFNMEKEINSLGKKEVNKNIEKIVRDIRSKKENRYTANFLMYGISKITYGIRLKQEKANFKQFKVESHCTGCRTCEKVCPVNNIKVTTMPTYGEHCISCYACSHNCPVNAIRVEGEKNKARFRNVNVNLSEIIEANNQLE